MDNCVLRQVERRKAAEVPERAVEMPQRIPVEIQPGQAIEATECIDLDASEAIATEIERLEGAEPVEGPRPQTRESVSGEV